MHSRRGARENRTFLRAGFVADGNDVGEELAGFEDIEDSLSFLARNIDPGFRHHLHRERVQRARFEAGALCLEIFAAGVIQPGRSHLAAGAVVNAYEEDALFHPHKVPRSRRNEKAGVAMSPNFHTIQRSRHPGFSTRAPLTYLPHAVGAGKFLSPGTTINLAL